jgi:hypothetical protein
MLHDAAAVHTPVFHHRPRPMLLAVLTPNLSAQKHDAGLARHSSRRKGLGRHYSRFSICQT